MYVKIRLLGYSFHPMLVAYPVTLYTVTVVAFIIYQLQGEVFWFRLGHLASKVGVMMGLVTVVPGLVSWLFGLPRNAPAKASDLWYLLLNAGGLALFATAAALNAGKWDAARPDNGLALILSAAGAGLTMAAGFYGWTFVQKESADEATVWQWQVRAARLAEELQQARDELALARAEVDQLRAQGDPQPRPLAQVDPPSSWSAVANRTWSAMADQAWFAAPETHANPLKLVLAVAVTIGGVAFLSVVIGLARMW
jgi:uncharacterized membrane protein